MDGVIKYLHKMGLAPKDISADMIGTVKILKIGTP